MRMSCNGCRVLRKGCSDNCSIRPCLQWIRNPEAQANATVFLAKFYGRAGLLNLINAGPDDIRPAIFRSLLYEACGRVVNPIYGSVGLLWSGSWQLCQAAVEAVLKGAPIVQVPSDTAAIPGPPLKAYDIRHVCKEETAAAQALHKVKSRSRFKRSAAKPKPSTESAAADRLRESEPDATPGSAASCDDFGQEGYPSGFLRAASHESSLSHQSEPHGDSTESMLSAETADGSLMSHCSEPAGSDESEVELELTLGYEPYVSRFNGSPSAPKPCIGLGDCCAESAKMELTFDLPA